ncbi:hypothetical protein H6P81_018681 [Aristolochia fimbriata]|uniref:Uncharacterized protein n=1 Tax=Aristolochia fimbriata TaxID=158543 RepID=A0AAV7E5T5_ARIFI|nr:hypothetical protein H6P81_018681 [Aristolochia fimbriata]
MLHTKVDGVPYGPPCHGPMVLGWLEVKASERLLMVREKAERGTGHSFVCVSEGRGGAGRGGAGEKKKYGVSDRESCHVGDAPAVGAPRSWEGPLYASDGPRGLSRPRLDNDDRNYFGFKGCCPLSSSFLATATNSNCVQRTTTGLYGPPDALDASVSAIFFLTSYWSSGNLLGVVAGREHVFVSSDNIKHWKRGESEGLFTNFRTLRMESGFHDGSFGQLCSVLFRVERGSNTLWETLDGRECGEGPNAPHPTLSVPTGYRVPTRNPPSTSHMVGNHYYSSSLPPPVSPFPTPLFCPIMRQQGKGRIGGSATTMQHL